MKKKQSTNVNRKYKECSHFSRHSLTYAYALHFSKLNSNIVQYIIISSFSTSENNSQSAKLLAEDPPSFVSRALLSRSLSRPLSCECRRLTHDRFPTISQLTPFSLGLCKESDVKKEPSSVISELLFSVSSVDRSIFQ